MQRAAIVSKASALAENNTLVSFNSTSETVESHHTTPSGVARTSGLENYTIFAKQIAAGKAEQEKSLQTIKVRELDPVLPLLYVDPISVTCSHRS